MEATVSILDSRFSISLRLGLGIAVVIRYETLTLHCSQSMMLLIELTLFQKLGCLNQCTLRILCVGIFKLFVAPLGESTILLLKVI